MADHESEPRHRRKRRDHDGGFTYVEVVITIVLMGIIVLPILAAVRSSVRAASVSREAAEVETVLVNAADRVSRADRDDFACDDELAMPAQQAALVQGSPWEASHVVVEVEHWDDSINAFVPGACPTTGAGYGLVQLVRITVTGPTEGITRQLEVVKGDF